MNFSLRYHIPVILLVSIIMLYGIPQYAYANNDPDTFGGGIDKAKQVDPSLKQPEPKSILKDIINFILSLIGIAAAGMIIVGGAMYITSAGEEEKAKKGKTIIFAAIIGLLVISLSAIVVNVVMRVIFGIT